MVEELPSHGRVVSRETTGVRSRGYGEPLATDAIFRIASMTRPVIGVAMMLLYEEGLWQLDDPIERFLPALGRLSVLEPDGRLVAPDHSPTMRELVSNTAGICGSASVAGGLRNGVGAEVRRRYVEARFQAGTLADMVDTIATLPLAGHPGRRFQYGLSQDVQGRIAEVLSGRPLDEFLRERVFVPLGMHDTGFVVRPEDTGRVVPMLTYGPAGSFEPAEPDKGAFPQFLADAGAGITPRFLSGGGGLFSTLPDYTAFAEMLVHGGAVPTGPGCSHRGPSR